MRRFNEDALKRAKDKKEKDAEYNSYPNFKARVIKKAQDEDYLNNVFKKYKFEVEDEPIMDIEDDYSSGTLEILVPEVSDEAGIDIFINAEKGKLSFLLAPFDYVNTEMEVPFGDDEEIFEGIFGFSSDEFYQEGDYDKLIKKLNELCGADVAKKAEEVLDNFFEENYDKISKIVGVNESKVRNEGIYTNDKEEENYQNFITGLERLSKKYGIGLSAVGCFDYWDENGFKSIKYKRDSSSGDLMIDELIFSDGERLE